MTRTLTPEHRAKIAEGMRHYVRTPEHQANLSISLRGRKMPETQRLNNSRAQTGKKLSDETKRKIGDAIRGAKHWNWKGGVPKFARWKDADYRAWQRAVFDRDGWTCQHCGYHNKRGEMLHAHHIMPYTGHPELRLEVSNGLALCVDCHMKHHGRKLRPAEPVFCACGCGGVLKPLSVAYGCRFLVGHNGRGRIRPEHERAAISAKMKGRQKSPETRARMSAAKRAMYEARRTERLSPDATS